MKTCITLILLAFVITTGIAQEKKITGIVSDQSGMPLPGVNVIVKGSTNGTQSDFDGKYEILSQAGDVLTYTYVGLKTVEYTVATSTIINVTMEEDAACLEEVVVTAMGIRRERRSMGYTISTIGNYSPSASQIKRQKQKTYHHSISKMLQGKVSGAQINNVNGNTGSNTNIFIRGNSSINGNKQPLYIVDGVPILSQYNSVIHSINPKDIDFVNVYKSRKAREIFGKSAKNGCIVISTKPGNYRLEYDESYAQINENSFEKVQLSPLSTFSIDVDKASYSNIRRMINNGQIVPFDAVKIEEMVNYFEYDYPQPQNEHPFSINTELVETPWNKDTKLVRIGLQGKTYENEELPAANLTFLIDVSGSMSSQNKLPLLKSAFKLLVNQLRSKDKVSIVVYAGAAGVVLKPTSGDNKEKIIKALENLQSGGSTAGGQGIELAYKLAEKNFVKNGSNRVILATDGDFNVGASSDKAMKILIEEKRQTGVFLSVLGFGYGNYKDSKLEILADKGNGNHAYIDNMQEAQKVFGKEFGGTLYTIAKDVKIQVEFNQNKVQAYRLIGYENRLLNDEDFKDDAKDAGELGSGHTVTALYEIIPVGVDSKYLKNVDNLKYAKANTVKGNSDELLTVKFRYKKPDEDQSIEIIHVLNDEVIKASEDFKFAAAVALFGMQLRKSQYFNEAKARDVLTLAESGRGNDKNGYRAEFIRLIKSYTN